MRNLGSNQTIEIQNVLIMINFYKARSISYEKIEHLTVRGPCLFKPSSLTRVCSQDVWLLKGKWHLLHR